MIQGSGSVCKILDQLWEEKELTCQYNCNIDQRQQLTFISSSWFDAGNA